ncbi:ELL-associated factor 1 [Manis javanica]|nr:ELL-associated factor 1 [Manis javanica]
MRNSSQRDKRRESGATDAAEEPSQLPLPPPLVTFRAPMKPPTGPKPSSKKDNPSPELQLDDIKRELRAEVDIIEQMSSSNSSSSDSESSLGRRDDSSSRWGEDGALRLPCSLHTSSPAAAGQRSKYP